MTPFIHLFIDSSLIDYLFMVIYSNKRTASILSLLVSNNIKQIFIGVYIFIKVLWYINVMLYGILYGILMLCYEIAC